MGTEIKRSRRKLDPHNAGLSKAIIVAAGIQLLDSVGVTKFGIRELARTIGVYPTALYWHLGGGLSVLVSEIVTSVSRGVLPPAGDKLAWQQWLTELFVRWRKAIRKHPNIVPLLFDMKSNPGEEADLVEGILRTLESAGFRNEALVDAYNTVVAAMLAFPSLEFAPTPQEGKKEWEAILRARLECLDEATYPVLARTKSRMLNRAFITRWQNGTTVPLDSSFSKFVRTFILGLEVQLSEAKQAPSIHATRAQREARVTRR